MIRVLVVGQTPPPHVGQFIMIEKMLNGHYRDVQLFHVRMAFSDSVDQIGLFRFGKVWHLFLLIWQIWWTRFRYRTTVLYYPPAGPNRIPVYRDIIILLATRWLFKKVIFHFHAGGISELYPDLSRPVQFLFRLAYGGGDVGIRLAPQNPPDSEVLNLRQDIIIPYGIDDNSLQLAKQCSENSRPEIIFVGTIRESKGVFVLLDACRLLLERGVDFQVKLVGGVDAVSTTVQLNKLIEQYKLQGRVIITGVLTGSKKWDAYACADIFCFPSHYESETFGLVVVEAMQFSLPVVATDWRGIGSIVVDGQTGFLVSPHDSIAVADKLEFLISHPKKADALGQKGRARYLTHYTSEMFERNIENLFVEVSK